MVRALLPVLVVLLASSAVAAQSSSRSTASCRRDDDLTELAAAVASFVRDHGGRMPDSGSLTRALRATGSGIPTVRAHVARAGASDAPMPVGPDDRCGSAEAGNASARFRVVLRARVEATWAVTTQRDGRLEVRVRLAPGLRGPEAFALDARGDARRVAETPSAGGIVVHLAAGDLPVRLQVLAADDRGPRPVVTLDLPSRGRDAPALAGLLTLPATPASVQRVVDRLMEVRGQAGARSARPNRLLSRLGRAHARAMCEADRVAHVVDRETGDLEQRASRLGLYARSLGEAVARSTDATSAIDAVMSSPSHRALVLDRRWTDLGVGTATDAHHRTCLVVVLAAWPRLR